MKKLSKQLSQVQLQLENLHEGFAGVLAEDLVQHVEKALEHVGEVTGALREAAL